MTSLSVVSDLVAGLHAEPLRQLAILLGALGQLAFDDERLMRGHPEGKEINVSVKQSNA